MRKIIDIVVILLMASGYAAAADYWHFGAGVRFTGVMPGEDYSSALGAGMLLTFGDPDSRFTTQIDFDNWSTNYTNEDTVMYSTMEQVGNDEFLWRKADHEYSGVGFGIFEKCRAFDFSSTFSTYAIVGFGAYFLDLKREERTDFGAVDMKSYGLHSLYQLSIGLGLENQFSSHFAAFAEGRYVAILNGETVVDDPNNPFDIDRVDDNLLKGLFGIRYIF
jgi:hypothetical protein